MSLKSTRRDFLRHAALGVGGLGLAETILGQLFQHLTYKAFAQSILPPNQSGYYFHLHFPGGPPRWLFDLPLTPAGLTSSNFIHGGFGTNFEVSAGVPNVVYKSMARTAGGQTLHLPPVWSYSTSKNFDTLLKHCLFVRGMDMEIDSHAISLQRQLSPVIGGVGLNGAVADASERALPSITDGSTGFKSYRGLSPTRVSNESSTVPNPITTALAPFSRLPATRNHVKFQNIALQEQVLSRVENEMQAAGFTENTLSDSYNKAAEVIDSNIQSLASNYLTVRNKYIGILNEAIRPSKGQLPGLFDKAVNINKTNSGFHVDSRDIPASNFTIADLRDISSSMTVAQLAQKFAIMEILTNKLSTNFSMAISNPSGLNLGGRSVGMTLDQHRTGRHVATLATTLYFRAVLACLTEFVDFLKGQNIFDHSIIHMSAEFNRTPRVDGSGSDHGWQGGNATLISGKFNKPEVIGNIYKQGNNLGTWGKGAPYYNENGTMRPIKVNDIARTVTAMLGVADVTTNGDSLVTPGSGGIWVPKKREANNV